MLVMSRKIGQEIMIGDSIRVTVLAVRGAHVRLGFEAPSEVRIQRDELLRGSIQPVAGLAGLRSRNHTPSKEGY